MDKQIRLKGIFIAVMLSLGAMAHAEPAEADHQVGASTPTGEVRDEIAGSCQQRLQSCQQDSAEALKKLKSFKYVCTARCRTRSPGFLSVYTIVMSHDEDKEVAFKKLGTACEGFKDAYGGHVHELVAFEGGAPNFLPPFGRLKMPLSSKSNCHQTD